MGDTYQEILQERDAFAALMELPPGPEGQPAGRATPADLKRYIEELQSEWDGAEQRLATAIRQRDGARQMARAQNVVIAGLMKAVNERIGASLPFMDPGALMAHLEQLVKQAKCEHGDWVHQGGRKICGKCGARE